MCMCYAVLFSLSSIVSLFFPIASYQKDMIYVGHCIPVYHSVADSSFGVCIVCLVESS